MDALRLNMLEKSLMDKVQHGDFVGMDPMDPMDPKAMTVKNRPQKRWKTIGKPEENGDLMRVYGGLIGFIVIYPLVNVYITMEHHHDFHR